MKALLCFLLVFFLFSSANVSAQPFGPPVYIADPVNIKCRYYFAGDEKHFNPRPENYTINIGYTTDFKSESQACEFFRCVYTNGTVLIDQNKQPIEKNLCICKEGAYWNNETGCMKIKQLEESIKQPEEEKQKDGFLSRIWKKWKKNFCES